MKDATLVKLGRLFCGTALLLAHVLTGVDGTLVVVSLFLLGVPFELIKKD